MRRLTTWMAGIAAIGLMAGSAVADGGSKITLEPIGHWHVYATKTLKFSVHDSHEKGVAGLNLTVQIVRTGSDRVSLRSVKKGQVVDEGNGVYALKYTAASLGSYALSANYHHDGETTVSPPTVFEVARDGDEGIKVEAKGTTYVYQTRYNWDPGHVHANDKAQVKLIFELLRGIPVGKDINWEKPYRNPFNHVNNAEKVTVTLVSKDGTVSENLTPVYKGRGIYEATRVFSVAEVGKERDYNVDISFLDLNNGAQVGNPESYLLHAVAGH